MQTKRVNSEMFRENPNRYELRPGTCNGAPLCPYGNHYQWVGYDKLTNQFVRFTKSVYKKQAALKSDFSL